MKSRTTTILLTLFLGGIGAHRFYLNKPTSGVFYLLFFWTWIPGIIAFFELIRFVFMSDKEFDKNYNQHYAKHSN